MTSQEELLEVIERLVLFFAKTMPDEPHEYVVKTLANEADYTGLFTAIREHGAWERYGKRRYRYLRPGDGWKYWIMTSQVGHSRIINRARVAEVEV
jgi:hypothetical protein